MALTEWLKSYQILKILYYSVYFGSTIEFRAASIQLFAHYFINTTPENQRPSLQISFLVHICNRCWVNNPEKVQKNNVQDLPDMWNSRKTLSDDGVEQQQTVAVTGGEGGPSPGLRLVKAWLSRPWEETLVDFEARLKYSQSYPWHPLIWAQPPWGPHSLKGGSSRFPKAPAREKEIQSGFFTFFGQHLTHPRSGFLNL